jgi:hypothetical protein
MATNSVAGSLFGTKDTKMSDVEFDFPDRLKTQNKQTLRTTINPEDQLGF